MRAAARLGSAVLTLAVALCTAAPQLGAQDDSADRLYREAREALSRQQYEMAAQSFERLRTAYPASTYVGDSFYWQAYALYRVPSRTNLEAASALLRAQAATFAGATTRADADELRVRVDAQLAQRGDATAAATIAQQAAGPCDEDQEVRLAALSALLNMNEEQAVPILQEVLRGRGECSVELRRRAVFLVSQKMTDESVDILLDLAHRDPDPDPEVREQAVFWLHQVDAPEALDALEAILAESTDTGLQERAIFAISQRSSDERAVQVLRSYAERADVPSELRMNAIFWISQNSSAGGAEYLMELYPRLEDEELKERAIFGIAQAGDDEARGWLLDVAMDTSESVEVRKNALFWAGQAGGLEMADLQGLYGTLEDEEMKKQVLFVASQSSGPEAVDFLMEVAGSEEDGELREGAIFWLGQSNDDRVADFLLELIRR